MSDTQTITVLSVDEPWHTERLAEPVRVGLPLERGLLTDPLELGLTLAGRPLPLQTRTLSRWPDGSVRWAQLDFQADLDLREPLTIDVIRGGERPKAPVPLTVTETTDGITVDTGAVAAKVSASQPLRLSMCTEASLSVVEERFGRLDPGSASTRVRLAGPLTAELVVEAELMSGGEHVMDARVLYRFCAGQSAAHAFITLISREQDVKVTQARVAASLDGVPTELRAHTGMKKARVSETELLFSYAVDARSDPIWYEDSPEPCWVLWRSESGGVAASVRNADHSFPVRMAAARSGLQIDLQPAGEAPFHMYPWMAKTHEVMIELVPPAKSLYDLTIDAALFQRPVRPVCGPEYYAKCEAFGDIFPTSRKYYGFESVISTSLRERTVGCGKMHYGDEPNLGYTYSQRGHDELVWTNGEYDTPRMLLMQYARTSSRSWFEAGEAAALHWMDIDFLRDSPNPRWAGGLCCHEGDHRVAAYAGPSHEWTEGLIDYYHLTGRDEALATAESIGDNVCRYIEDGEFDEVGTYALRELGWGLTAIAGCLRATNKDRYRETGMRAVRILQRWVESFGGLKDVGSYKDPVTGQRQPLTVARDAFISLTLNGLNKFYMASGEEEAKELFLREVKAQLEWFESPAGWAEMRETKIPNVEAFGYGYEYTGDRAYLRAGMQILQYVLGNCYLRYYNMQRPVLDTSREHPASYRFQEVHAINSQILGLALIPMFSFLQTAEEAGVLEPALGARDSGLRTEN